MNVAIDCAGALAEWLRENGHEAFATPLPDDFMDRMPATLVRASGGQRTWPVLDRHRLGLDTYGETMGDAMEEAAAVHALIDEINAFGATLSGRQAYHVDFGGLPQESEDPDHPDAPMATFVAEVSVRAAHID